MNVEVYGSKLKRNIKCFNDISRDCKNYFNSYTIYGTSSPEIRHMYKGRNTHLILRFLESVATYIFDYPLQTKMKAKCFRQNNDLAAA